VGTIQLLFLELGDSVVNKKKLNKYVDATTTPTVLALFAVGLSGCSSSSSTSNVVVDDGDSFDKLTVIQGTGDNTADTVISLTTTGEILAVLDNFTATNFDANDFVALDIV
jgi:putative methionine-R-sulfoxide reductase with GAF domain